MNLAVFAAVFVFGLAACDTQSARPELTESTMSETEVTTTTAKPSASAPSLTEGTEHVMTLATYPMINLVAPDTWERVQSWVIVRDSETEAAMTVSFWSVIRLYGHPCQWSGTLFDPGSSVDDLAAALVDVPMRDATPPEPASVGGVDGLYLEWSVPDDANFSECDQGFFESWTGAFGGSDRYQQAPGQVDRLWVLDVDGRRLVIDASYLPGSKPADRSEIDAIVSSIKFGR